MTAAARNAVLLMIFLCSLLEGANVVQFGSIKIRTSLEASPAVLRSTAGSGMYSGGGVSLVNNRWLAVQVSFMPGAVDSRVAGAAMKTGNVKSVVAVPGRWIDDVTMRVSVAFPAANARRSNVVYGLFEGNTCFWSIKLDGRRHNAMMFVPPQLIERYAASVTTGRKELQLGVTDFIVFVEFTDSNGAVLGRSCSRKSGDISGMYKFFQTLKKSPAATVVRGALLPRSKSPWAWHLPSTFDYIKDTAAEKTL